MNPPENSALLRYGDVIQLTDQVPSVPGITEGKLGVVFSAEVGDPLMIFPVTTAEDNPKHPDEAGSVRLGEPEATTVLNNVRIFGRMTLYQVRTALVGHVTDERVQRELTDFYANKETYRQEPWDVHPRTFNESTPYVPELRAEVDAVLEDIGEINRRLTEAGRPDLLMTEQAKMQPVNTPEDLVTKNNFIPKLMRMGPMASGDRLTTDPIGDVFWHHYRPPNDDEYARLVSIAGQDPMYYESAMFKLNAEGFPIAIGEGAAGFSSYQIEDWQNGSHLSRRFFARMMVLFPTYTKRILEDCVGRHPHDRPDNVLINAYQVMSKLVDVDDPNVIRARTGEVDDWYLAR